MTNRAGRTHLYCQRELEQRVYSTHPLEPGSTGNSNKTWSGEHIISIYESGSYDNTKGALTELDQELDRLCVPRNITLSPITHQDEISAAPGDEG